MHLYDGCDELSRPEGFARQWWTVLCYYYQLLLNQTEAFRFAAVYTRGSFDSRQDVLLSDFSSIGHNSHIFLAFLLAVGPVLHLLY